MNIYQKIYNASPVPFQHALVSAYGYRWKQRRMGGIFPKEYEAARAREQFSQSQWESYQQEQFQKIIQHAWKTVPYYQKTFRAAGINESNLRAMDIQHIDRLPILTKEELRKYGTTELLSIEREKKSSFFSSSGSTGTPVQILFSQAMHQRWYALFECRVRNWAGVSSSQPRGMIGGRRVLPEASGKAPFYRYNFFEKQVYFSTYHINKKNAADYVNGMWKYKIDYMTGYAMANYILARFIRENQLTAPALKCVITSSEKLTAEMRAVFRDVYHCASYDGWSGVEACGLISECAHGGLHISPDAGLIEVLDENLQPVKAGTPGNVYCTGFINRDQPLIRYAIGDQLILSTKSCACGREMPLVEEICGREEDVIIGRDGRQMVRFHSIFYDLTSVLRAQVIQHSLDEIIIKTETANGLLKEDEEKIKQRLRTQLEQVHIRIDDCRKIPLTKNGKFQAVISTIKPA